MPAVTGIVSYGNVGNREDLIDVIQLLGVDDTPVFSNARKTKAKATTHEWQEDDLAAAATNALVEGADYTLGAANTRKRIGNVTQIFNKTAKVTATQEAVDVAGTSSEMAYQLEKASKEIGRDIDKAMIKQAKVAGNNSATPVARQASGIIDMANAANKTTYASTGIVYADINKAAQLIREAGAMPTDIVAGGSLKAAISGMTTPAVKYQEMNRSDEIRGAINVIDSDFGRLKISLDIQTPADTVLVYDNSMVEVAVLRPIETKDVPPIGSYIAKVIEGELTFVLRHSKAAAVLTKGT